MCADRVSYFASFPVRQHLGGFARGSCLCVINNIAIDSSSLTEALSLSALYCFESDSMKSNLTHPEFISTGKIAK